MVLYNSKQHTCIYINLVSYFVLIDFSLWLCLICRRFEIYDFIVHQYRVEKLMDDEIKERIYHSCMELLKLYSLE